MSTASSLAPGSRFTAFPPENATGNFVKIVQRVPVKILIDSGLDPEHSPAPRPLRHPDRASRDASPDRGGPRPNAAMPGIA